MECYFIQHIDFNAKLFELFHLYTTINVIMMQVIATIMIRHSNNLLCDYNELISKESFYYWIPMQHCNFNRFTLFLLSSSIYFHLNIFIKLSHLHSSLFDGVILLYFLPPKRCLMQCNELNIIIIIIHAYVHQIDARIYLNRCAMWIF